MPSATLMATIGVLLAAVFLFGRYLGRVSRDRVWEYRMAAIRRLSVTPTETPPRDEWRRDIEFVARSIAYARAAEAVCLWPHRIDRKADLARHIESLATAPELGAATPNPEPASDVEALPASPVSSAAPVLAATVGADEDIGVESGNEGRIDPMEGFL